ncbi:MAG: phage tail sheath C-terminal domain-containing protein [Reichenbachiella sp.]|uniref:phage tail sheath family protein n=1 Tax=Reichenbachiella sp. TaxID=2184521 RepID=UPI003265A955
MAVSYKTPGVYIEEKNAFPNSVVAVATAVPAFIGYTKKAERQGKSVFGKPIRITSLVEFEQIFGGAPNYKFTIDTLDAEAAKKERETFPLGLGADRKEYKITWSEGIFRLYNSVRIFYQNGGGNCWIVSLGSTDTAELVKDDIVAAIDLLKDEPEPTMVLVPDAPSFADASDCFSVYTACLDHCQAEQNRVTLMDVPGANSDQVFVDRDLIKAFRGGVGSNYLQWGASYFPWLDTNVVSDREITFLNFDIDTLKPLLLVAEPTPDPDANDKQKAKEAKILEEVQSHNAAIERILKTVPTPDKEGYYTIIPENPDGTDGDAKNVEESLFLAVEANLRGMSSVYKSIVVKEAVKKLNLLPASAAMAGVYTAVDNSRGVWKAPANVSLNSVIAPNYTISNDLNDELNMPLNGKAVNAIRSFPGQGVIVWGARTLDGNSQDWRYVNVRRTMIFLEQSIKAAARAYVFEPNDANTWVLVQGMISNFLNNVWKAGGLFGSTPGDAYDVQVGLGTTMTANDILDGYMRITVRVAVVRPAEFIVITFQQKMPES